MPRPRKHVRRRKIHISLPEDVLAVIETQFFDPVRQRPRYGIHARLITGLLKKWIVDPSIYPITTETYEEITEDEIDD